ncbi:MAG: hypothetical protein KAW12_00765 [Candidatus Aminicenantes bacterium]|nr:hypothetical protein [Candidatus Aminicenantes bacterium]
MIFINTLQKFFKMRNFFFKPPGTGIVIDRGRRPHALYAAYFFLGLFSLVSQTMILREFLTVVYGNELILGVLLFHWLTGIFVGALCGGTAADKSKKPLLLFAASLAALCLLLPLIITAVRFLYLLSSTTAGTYVSFFKVFLLSGIFIIPFCFFIGFSFPAAAKIQAAEDVPSREKTRKISHIYILEAWGFLTGGILYTFVLAGRCSPYFITGLIVLPLLLSCSLILRRSQFYKTLYFTIILLLLNTALLIPTLHGKIETLTVKERWRGISPIPLLYTAESKYQDIALAGLPGQYNLYLNNMFAAVFPADEENRILAAHLLCQHPASKRVLVIGDALTGLAKHLLRYDVEKIVSVEIDPLMVETLLKFLPEEEKKVLQDSRFHLVIEDGRKYVQELTGKPPVFDMVYINVPEPATLLLNRYYTRDFFQDLKKILPRDGVVAFKITSSENYLTGLVGEYAACLYQTAAAVFPEMVVAPGSHNFVFAGRGKSVISDDPEILSRRYAETGVQPQKLGGIFYSLYPEEKTKFVKEALKNNHGAGINRDEQPTANFYFSKIIGWYAGTDITGILNFFEKVQLSHLLYCAAFLFLLRLLYIIILRLRAKQDGADYAFRVLKFHTLLAVFCCGLAGLSLELILLYTFQVMFGYVYHMIGFIIALFMFGLPLGAAFANFLPARKKFSSQTAVIKLMIFSQLFLAAVALLVGRLSKIPGNRGLTGQIVIFLLTILVGFIVGKIFPLSLHIILNKKEKTGGTAGKINAFDHLGAAVGALFLGTLFLPLLGAAGVCLLTAVFLLSSSLLLAAGFFAFCSQKNRFLKKIAG